MKAERKKRTMLDGLKDQVDEAFELQQAVGEANKKYNAARKRLEALMRDTVGQDVLVVGEEGKAMLRRKKQTVVDPLELLRQVRSNDVRRKCLKVMLTAARRLIDPQTWKGLALERWSEEPELRVWSKTAKEDDDHDES